MSERIVQSLVPLGESPVQNQEFAQRVIPYDLDGNVRDKNNPLPVADMRSYRTPSGSQFVESIRDDINLDFGKVKYAASIAKMTDRSVGGSVSQDATNGQAVFATGASAGNIVYFESSFSEIYETAHALRYDITIELSRALTGNEKVEWGLGENDASLSVNDIYNAVGFGRDASGVYTFIKKNGTYTHKVYQNSWNIEKCDGVAPSNFVFNGSPAILNTLKNNYYGGHLDWLGAYPPEYFLVSPNGGGPLVVNTIEYANNNNGSTVPHAALKCFIRAKTDGTQLEVRSGSIRGGIFTSKVVLTGKMENGINGDVGLTNLGNLKTALVERPSQVINRVRVEIIDPRRSLVGGAGNTIYTVTSGYDLYISSPTITYLNDANAIGEWHIRDGTTAKIPLGATNKAVGAASGQGAPSPTLFEPWKFSTNVNLLEVSGDIITFINLIGYEEPV